MSQATAAPASPATAPPTPIAAAVQRAVSWSVEDAGDAVILRSPTCVSIRPDTWRATLIDALRQHPDVAVVGCKRLDPAGHVFSMGEFVVHPKSFHHHGLGVVGQNFRFVEEADLITGGVMAIRRDAFERAGGEAALQGGALGMIELGLRIRRDIGRCIVVPQAVAVDASTVQSTPAEDAAFRDRWKFDWRVADLDDVRAAHRGTGLLWNARFHASGLPFEKYTERGPLVWESYKAYEPFRQRAHHIAGLAKKMCPPGSGVLVDVGSGDGFFSSLFAKEGVKVLGFDPEPDGVAVARRMTAEQTYPGPRPEFAVGRGDNLPFATGAARAVTLMDVIEHLPNPVPILRELTRILAPGGQLLVITPEWRYGTSSDPTYHLTEYTCNELNQQINNVGGLRVTSLGRISGVYHDAVALATRV